MCLILLGFVAGCLNSYLRPLPSPKQVKFQINTPAQKVEIPWPWHGQSAVGASGYGLLAAGPKQVPVPTASVAKVITALAVLQKYPLKIGQEGPTITLTKKDEQIYNYYLSKNGTVVPVTAGLKISEYEALEAMLLPSANNIADTLAIWAFGSLASYNEVANQLMNDLGAHSSSITGASGFSKTTTSTAADLVLAASAALENPVVSQIMSKKSAQTSLGRLKTTNKGLGQDGIFGIKTGHTDEARGCYLFSTHKTLSGHVVTIYGAILGDASVDKAVKDALALIDETARGFGQQKLVTRGQKVGYFQTAWGQQIPLAAKTDLNSFGWLGVSTGSTLQINSTRLPIARETIVGQINSGTSHANVETVSSSNRPSLGWRLFHWL